MKRDFIKILKCCCGFLITSLIMEIFSAVPFFSISLPILELIYKIKILEPLYAIFILFGGLLSPILIPMFVVSAIVSIYLMVKHKIGKWYTIMGYLAIVAVILWLHVNYIIPICHLMTHG